MLDQFGRPLSVGNPVLILAKIEVMDSDNATVRTCFARSVDGEFETIFSIDSGVLLRSLPHDLAANDTSIRCISADLPDIAVQRTVYTGGGRTVSTLDERGAGNAFHVYEVSFGSAGGDPMTFGRIVFQNGPIKENGHNGLHNEDLLWIVAHRLECFQNSPYACSENGEALHHVQEALRALEARTARRTAEGKEGTHAV